MEIPGDRFDRRLKQLLIAAVRRVCALNVPIPYSPGLEDHVFPDREKIAAGVRASHAQTGRSKAATGANTVKSDVSMPATRRT